MIYLSCLGFPGFYAVLNRFENRRTLVPQNLQNQYCVNYIKYRYGKVEDI